MLEVEVIFFGLVVIIFFLIISYFFKFYKKCPPGHIMVIYNNKSDVFGNTIKVIHSGGAFVWPTSGSFQLFNLTPFTIEQKMQNLLTHDQQKVDLELKVIAAISTREITLQNAVERISGLTHEQLKSLSSDLISSQIRFAIISMKAGEIKESAEFTALLSKLLEEEISKIGLKIINTDIKNIKLH